MAGMGGSRTGEQGPNRQRRVRTEVRRRFVRLPLKPITAAAVIALPWERVFVGEAVLKYCDIKGVFARIDGDPPAPASWEKGKRQATSAAQETM